MSKTSVNIIAKSNQMPKITQKDVSGTMLKALKRLEYGRWLTSKDINAYPRTMESLYKKGFVERGMLETSNKPQNEKILYRLTEEGHKFINLYCKVPLKEQGRYFFTRAIDSVRN